MLLFVEAGVQHYAPINFFYNNVKFNVKLDELIKIDNNLIILKKWRKLNKIFRSKSKFQI